MAGCFKPWCGVDGKLCVDCAMGGSLVECRQGYEYDYGRIEHYFVTRRHCKNCDGAGYFSHPITAERNVCADCKGEGFRESREMLTADEADRCKAVIDWNAEALVGRR